MSYFETYKKHLAKQGTTVLEARTNTAKREINRTFSLTHGYNKATLQEDYTKEAVDIDIVIKSDNSELEKTILFRPDTKVRVGSYVEVNNKIYILRELDEDQLSPKGMCFYCNRHINLKGIDKPLYCYTNSTTYGSKGILDQDKFYELDSKTKIYIQRNQYTDTIKIGQRIMFANKYVYKITELDDLVFPNLIVCVAQRDETMPMDDFENNLAWNAYEDIVVGDNDEETLSEIIGEEKVKLNETGTYTINKSVDWEIDDLTIATMSSKTDTSIRIKGIKRGWITLKATDQTGTTYEKDIMIC